MKCFISKFKEGKKRLDEVKRLKKKKKNFYWVFLK